MVFVNENVIYIDVNKIAMDCVIYTVLNDLLSKTISRFTHR